MALSVRAFPSGRQDPAARLSIAISQSIAAYLTPPNSKQLKASRSSSKIPKLKQTTKQTRTLDEKRTLFSYRQRSHMQG